MTSRGLAMKKSWFLAAVMPCLLLFQSGCYTNMYVNFGNDTDRKISVKEVQTGQEVQIAPGTFRKIPHGHADLIVTAADNNRYMFNGVKVVDTAMDPKYYERGFNWFGIGVWRVYFNVVLSTNMDLYALLPGKKVVDASVPQPDGYPKAGNIVAK
jgi:hypothetical protein